MIGIPVLVGKAVDAGLLGHHWRRLFILAAGVAALGVVQGLAAGIRRRCNGIASHRVEAELRRGFFTRLLDLDIAYHDQVNRGQLLSRVTSDMFQVQSLVASTPAWIANCVAIAGVAVVLVSINPLLGLVGLAALPSVAITSKKYAARIRPALGELQLARGHLAGVVEEAISGVRAVKGFGAERTLEERLGAQADAVRTEALDVVRKRTTYNPVLTVVPMMELVAVNWLGGYLVLHHQLTIGMLLAFNAYVAVLNGPLRSFGWFIQQIERALVSARRLEVVMSRQPSIRDPENARALPEGPGSVRLRGVCFAYPGSARPILHDFDLDIAGNEVVAIVGGTGSGKTTLAALIARLYDPQAGSVSIDGVDLRELPVDTVRAAVAVVFEDSFLFDQSVMENVRVGRSDANDDEVVAAAELGQAHEFVAELPGGYATVVGERGFALSGGQRQRLALARAVLASPRILILDDATSAVDAAKERDIIEGMERMLGTRTIIVISHRAATVALADRVVFLEAGKVAAVGTHEELLAGCERYAQVLDGEGPVAITSDAEAAGEGAA